MQKPLIIVYDNPYQKKEQQVKGITDYYLFFKSTFDKVWPKSDSLHYITTDSLQSLIWNGEPQKYSFIRLGDIVTSVRNMSGGTSWRALFQIGLFDGEDYLWLKKKHQAISRLDKPVLTYRFGNDEYFTNTASAPVFDSELLLAVKFMNDEIQCELNKKGCNYKDEAKANKALLKGRTLLITKALVDSACLAKAASFFPCPVKIVDNVTDYLNTTDSVKYAFLAVASPKLRNVWNTYFIADMKTLQLLGYNIPHDQNRMPGMELIHEDRLQKIAELYKE